MPKQLLSRITLSIRPLVALMLLAGICIAGVAYPALAQDVTPIAPEAVAPISPAEAPLFDPNQKPTPEQLEQLKRRVGIDIFEGSSTFGDASAPDSSSLRARPDSGKAASRKQNLRRKQALRRSAFELEKVAHRLENLELYDDADSLREKAAHLRNVARKIGQLVHVD